MTPEWTEADTLHYRWRRIRGEALSAFEACCANPEPEKIGVLSALIQDTYVARRAWVDAVQEAR